MSRNDDNDDLDTTLPSGGVLAIDPTREIGEAFDDLEDLLKNGDVVGALSARGINTSLALVAVQGLRAYLTGNKAQAADDLGTVAEEIKARMDAARADGRAADRGSSRGGGGGKTS
jgi:hypothetical protein